MAFPFEETQIATVPAQRVPREYELDTNTGQITGRIVEGKEAVKIWAYKALKTSRYMHLIYSWDFGNEIEDLLEGQASREFLEDEAKRLIEDCLSLNEYITGIENIELIIDNDKLTVSFTINTIYGEVNMNV